MRKYQAENIKVLIEEIEKLENMSTEEWINQLVSNGEHFRSKAKVVAEFKRLLQDDVKAIVAKVA